MLKSINKIPAGTFLVPMILSAFIYTFWPDLFHVGGLTEGLLSGSGMPFITGALSFFSGTGMKLAALLSLLGWNIGQGLDLTDATQSGLIGLLLVGVYYLYNLYQYPLDTNIEK